MTPAHQDEPQAWRCPIGTLVLGASLIGAGPALAADWVLWSAGTALGLVTCCWIPCLMMTRHQIGADGAFGGWLMPVVPPMVSAADGALLIPHLPPGQARLTLLLACYAMFGISLAASMIIITQIWSRLVHYKIGPAVMVPTLWIVLGRSASPSPPPGSWAPRPPGCCPSPMPPARPTSRCCTASRCGGSP